MDPLIPRSVAASIDQRIQSRKRVAIISVASIVVVAAIMFVAFGIVSLNSDKEESVSATELEDPIETACRRTLYPKICSASLSPYLISSPKMLLHIATMVAVNEANRALAIASELYKMSNESSARIAIQDCEELIGITKDQLDSSIFLLKRVKMEALTETKAGDIKTWLSAAITNMETCYDGILENSDGKYESSLLSSVYRAKVLTSNSLAILVNTISNELGLLSDQINEFPSWLSAQDRRTLAGSSPNEIEPHVTVAADGSGDFKTITEAIDAAPNKTKTRYVIKVKKGTYSEYLEVGKKKTNIMLVGEGMENTTITGSRNVIDGSTTFRSATFAAVGEGFMAQDIAFVNTAGPAKHQAVALRVGSDQSVFYRCKIVGYQDTLYTHSLRQFYRDCLISGTVDFIFGNAAVVFQDCTLLPRKPGENQKNAITAQGRTDRNQVTGISIHRCKITADSDLVPLISSFPTYLGRPWKEYSRTVVMQSVLDNVIDPKGWLEWDGDFALSTLYYGEYMNTGAGAGTENRVKWPGYRVINSSEEATKYTVGEFIQGNEWLQSSGVDYIDGLTD